MYSLELMNNEEVIRIFDEIFVKQNKNEKITTIVLTNKRLLFLDYPCGRKQIFANFH